MPYLCHTHNGLYEAVDGIEGCQAKACISLRNSNPPKHVIFGAVPGGTLGTSIQKAHAQKFDSDMHAYREARRQGLEPEMITKEAAITAEKIANGDKPEHDRYSGALNGA